MDGHSGKRRKDTGCEKTIFTEQSEGVYSSKPKEGDAKMFEEKEESP